MSADTIVAALDQAIVNAASFQSMTADGDTTVHQNIKSLMDVRNELKQEEELANGTRRTFATFDLSEQNF